MGEHMANFAKLDENNVVVEVVIVNNDDISNLPFPESEAVGIAYLNSFLPAANWKQTSRNNNFRVRYAGVGSTFHPEHGEYGGFAQSKLADNFVWDDATCNWIPPIPYPNDGHSYYWNFQFNKWSPMPVEPPQTTVIG